MIAVSEVLELAGSEQGRRWIRTNLRKRLRSRHVSICLRRDFDIALADPPSATLPVVIRQLRPDDDLSLIADEPGLTPQVRQLRQDQRWLLTQDLPAPWVAIDADGKVAMMTYFLTAQDNSRIAALWGDWLPQLQADQGIFEAYFTADHYRGRNLMPAVADVIFGRENNAAGIRYALGIIPEHNAASLRGGEKSGFHPHLKRIESWVLFRRTIRFVPYVHEPQHV